MLGWEELGHTEFGTETQGTCQGARRFFIHLIFTQYVLFLAIYSNGENERERVRLKASYEQKAAVVFQIPQLSSNSASGFPLGGPG